MTNSAKIRRRWFGGICLLAAIGMLTFGDTTPGKHLDGIAFVIYWLACFGFATLALFTAIFDARALRREARDEQRALLESTLEGIQEQKAHRSKPKTPQGPENSD